MCAHLLQSDSIWPGTIAHDSKIPRDRLRFVNTDVVLYGEKMAQYRAAQAAYDRDFVNHRKVPSERSSVCNLFTSTIRSQHTDIVFHADAQSAA